MLKSLEDRFKKTKAGRHNYIRTSPMFRNCYTENYVEWLEKEVLKAEAKLKVEWYSVEHYLPNNDKAFSYNNAGVLWVKIKDGDIQTSAYDEETGFYYKDVTHWAYLKKPQLPKN